MEADMSGCGTTVEGERNHGEDATQSKEAGRIGE